MLESQKGFPPGGRKIKFAICNTGVEEESARN